MEAVGALAVMAAFVLAWWGLNTFAKKREWKWWQRHPLGAVAGIVAMFLVTAIVMPTPPAADAPQEGTAAIAASSQQPTSDADGAGMSAEEYVARFNDRLGVTTLEVRGMLGDTTEGPVNDSRTIAVSDLHSIVLSINKASHAVTGVMLIAQGDGSAESGADTVVIAVSALTAAAKDQPGRTVGNAVLDLIASREGEETVVREVGPLVLSHQFSEILGTAFFTADIQDSADRG